MDRGLVIGVVVDTLNDVDLTACGPVGTCRTRGARSSSVR